MHNNYAVITARVLMNKNLTSTQKLLIALISNLSNAMGYCFASNKYLGDCLDISPRAVRDALNFLENEKVLLRVVKLKTNLSVEFRSLIIDFNCDFLMGAEMPICTEDETIPPRNSTATPQEVDFRTPGSRLPHNNKYNNKYKKDISLEQSSSGDTDSSIHSNSQKKITKETGGRGAVYDEGVKFANWFNENHKVDSVPSRIADWAMAYARLITIDKKTKEEVKKAVVWARADEFWSKNFLSPLKLRQKNKDGQMYIDVFLERMKSEKPKETKSQYSNKPYNPTGAHLDGQ